jgi:hypothetical protein
MADFNKSKYVPFWFSIQIENYRNVPSQKGTLRIGNLIIRSTSEHGEVAIEDTETTKVVKLNLVDFENAINELMESTFRKYQKGD